jgi:hypothetical protein
LAYENKLNNPKIIPPPRKSRPPKPRRPRTKTPFEMMVERGWILEDGTWIRPKLAEIEGEGEP